MLSETNKEKVLKIINEATDAGASQFKPSIRAVYGQSEKQQPYHIGSCIFLSIKSKKYLLTVAHIIDESKDTPLYINGVGNELVCIQYRFILTNRPALGREADMYDFAWAHLSDESIKLCGENDFIPEEKFTDGTENPKGRIYLALGYPCSKNKPNVFKKTITPAYFRYADIVKNDETLCKKLKVSGAEHLFFNYNFKHSMNDKGDLINSIEPRGLSGGVLVDMGKFVDWHKSADKPTGKLAGMIFMKHEDRNTIVAVKIGAIVNLIKQRQTEDSKGISGH